MAKVKTTWFCKECGHEAAKWIGNCPSCQQWNTFTEEKVVKKSFPVLYIQAVYYFVSISPL